MRLWIRALLVQNTSFTRIVNNVFGDKCRAENGVRFRGENRGADRRIGVFYVNLRGRRREPESYTFPLHVVPACGINFANHEFCSQTHRALSLSRLIAICVFQFRFRTSAGERE